MLSAGYTQKNTLPKRSVSSRTISDYSPFGVLLPERAVNAGDFRYGFQGQEHDDEVSGSGNHYTAEYWEYDPRLGRRWNVDPVVKFHESSYACYANNPIWFGDPNGADSAIANGSNTWQWNVESGDTYSGISKRTGVSVDNLRSWNGYADKSIPIGALLHLSDPSADPPSSRANMTTSSGDISLLVFEPRTIEKYGIAKLYVGLTFIPNSANQEEEFIWFQTVNSNDPLEGSDGSADRLLRDAGDYGYASDYDNVLRSGKIVARFGQINSKGNIIPFSSPEGATPMHDAPSRTFINSGTINWNGYLQVMKKVGDSYIKVATIKYSFQMTGQNIESTILRFNPVENPNDADTKYHNQKFDEWNLTH